jgi:hypothetical protein
MNRPLRPAALTLCVLLAACRAGTGASSSASEPGATPTVAPSATAEASAAASEAASSEPTQSASSGAELGEFEVAPNVEADALFLDRDNCENLADYYRVQFPDAWYTNTAIGDVEPCQWFSPSFYEVGDASEVPAEIAIEITLVDGAVGSVNQVIARADGMVGVTQPATRWEEQGSGTEGGAYPSTYRAYVYVVQLGPTTERGPNLLIQTSTDMGGDYELNKAVMDRIVATMELLGTIQ